MTIAGTIYQLEIETRSVTQFLNGWREKRESHGVAHAHEMAHGTSGDGGDCLFGIGALRPVFQHHKTQCRVLCHTGEVEAGYRHHMLDVMPFFIQQIVLDLFDTFQCTFCCGTRWCTHLEE